MINQISNGVNLNFIDNKTVLITGGTGSFGKNFVKFLLNNSRAKKIIVFSRDEFKQFRMEKEFKDGRLRFFIGDVRDLPRLERAFNGVDIVVHAAALKQVPILEYNPFEAVKTNILGSQNVIEAAIDQRVEKVLLVSTDKAVQPINLYGSTKLCAEKLFISGNSYSPDQSKFSAVRYGNVIGSRGSIIETLIDNQDSKVQVTDLDMTRFWITFDQSFALVIYALENMQGGEIFVPKIPSMKLIDLFDALAPNAEKKVIGMRPGEKLHEVLISKEESRHSLEFNSYYVILPEFIFSDAVKLAFVKYYGKGKKLAKDFKYASDLNSDWLDKDKLNELIKKI